MMADQKAADEEWVAADVIVMTIDIKIIPTIKNGIAAKSKNNEELRSFPCFISL